VLTLMNFRYKDTIADWHRYVRLIGPPRAVRCDVDLGGNSGPVWICRTHDIGFQERRHLLDGRLDDRCPVSRLEEWRARRWEYLAKSTATA
jgi:hypothetical protein